MAELNLFANLFSSLRKVTYFSFTQITLYFSTSSYCSPTTPRRIYQGTDSPNNLQYYAGPHSNLQFHAAANTLQYNPAAFTSPVQYSTQKKRTLVQYKYPDVLPSEKLNQNYYV